MTNDELVARLEALERRQRRLMMEFRRASLTIVRAIEQECDIKPDALIREYRQEQSRRDKARLDVTAR